METVYQVVELLGSLLVPAVLILEYFDRKKYGDVYAQAERKRENRIGAIGLSVLVVLAVLCGLILNFRGDAAPVAHTLQYVRVFLFAVGLVLLVRFFVRRKRRRQALSGKAV